MGLHHDAKVKSGVRRALQAHTVPAWRDAVLGSDGDGTPSWLR